MPESRNAAAMCRVRPVSRRRFVGAATGVLAAPVLAGTVAAQEELNETPEAGTPVASPAVSIDIDVEALYALSQTLVGGGNLNRDAADPLAKLIGADDGLVSGFEELIQLEDPTTDDARSGMSENASEVVTNILLYWYVGYFGDQPVENRVAMFFNLPVWSTVPYFTQPTLCKGYGYWAAEVEVGE